MNPQVLNSQVTAAFPSSEMPPPNDLMCFDPQNDVHILTLGATSMFIAAFLGFFFASIPFEKQPGTAKVGGRTFSMITSGGRCGTFRLGQVQGAGSKFHMLRVGFDLPTVRRG